nr:MAG TPA: Replication associated protein [Microviridae sp.]
MPCFNPSVLAVMPWKDEKGGSILKYAGKYIGDSLAYDYRIRDNTVYRIVPCGQCIGCRLDNSRQWAVRGVHEASLYDNNCFLTLTFREECLPDDLSVRIEHVQRFIKNLRKKYGSGIRYFGCGEYGDKFGRPHYHIILFNFDFSDKQYYFTNKHGDKCYTSVEAEKRWPYGNVIVAGVSFKSIAYVARYVTKKITGERADAHYQGRHPEFVCCSTRPGIGHDWLDKFGEQCYDKGGKIDFDGHVINTPRYYDKIWAQKHPEWIEAIKEYRQRDAARHLADNTPDRLAVREELMHIRKNLLPRSLESEI